MDNEESPVLKGPSNLNPIAEDDGAEKRLLIWQFVEFSLHVFVVVTEFNREKESGGRMNRKRPNRLSYHVVRCCVFLYSMIMEC